MTWQKVLLPVLVSAIYGAFNEGNPRADYPFRQKLDSILQQYRSRGELVAEGTVVEYTGGSTGTSLAFVCAALGYYLTIVTSDAFSRKKRDHMRALGADVLASVQIAARLGSDHNVVTIACDSGLKYLTTDLYSYA